LRRWHADVRSMEHLGGGPTDDPADTERALARWNAHWDEHGFGLLAGELRQTGALVSRGGPQYHRVWPADPELGWAVEPALWGRGLATELGAAALAWTFGPLGFRAAVSVTTEANHPSRRVIEKLGFELLTTIADERSGRELWVYRQEAPLD
jgi:RimJ/RimL family protein N-acetyltransferase